LAAVESAVYRAPYAGPRRERLAHTLRIMHVMAAVEFKLKWSGSHLGYFWTIAKPLALFSVMYEVFSHIVKLGGFPHFGVYLLVGIIFWTFFMDATMTAMPSIVVRGSLIRKLSFPRLTIPLAVTLTAVFSFAVNLIVIVVFIAGTRLTPRIEWLAVLPLLLELYVFSVAVALILATLFVQFRDVGQVWELGSQILFYGAAVMYPIQFLPKWGQGAALIFPFAQIMQDARTVLIHPAANYPTFTPYYFGSDGRIIPIALTFVLAVASLWLFRREAPRFAERV
jgi:ABC-2 type transport system permease protein